MSPSTRARSARAVTIAVLLVGIAPELGAHDFWLGPSSFRPRIGALVGLRLLVGQDMVGDPVTREPEAIKQFVVATRDSVTPVAGRDGGDPAGIIRVAAHGLLVVGYESHPRAIELAPDKLNQSPGEEGLDEESAGIRRSAGTRPLATAREMYLALRESPVVEWRSGCAARPPARTHAGARDGAKPVCDHRRPGSCPLC